MDTIVSAQLPHATPTPQVTTGPLPASRKVYVTPDAAPDLSVPLREIALSSPTESAVRVYDTTGPYSDPDAKIELYRMLRDINRELGVTIVMVSHDLELAAEVAHNALCLDHDVCFWGDVQQALVHRHKHGYFYR